MLWKTTLEQEVDEIYVLEGDVSDYKVQKSPKRYGKFALFLPTCKVPLSTKRLFTSGATVRTTPEVRENKTPTK